MILTRISVMCCIYMHRSDDFWHGLRTERFLRDHYFCSLAEELHSTVCPKSCVSSPAFPRSCLRMILPCYPIQQSCNQRDSHCSSLDQMLVVACAGSWTWTNGQRAASNPFCIISISSLPSDNSKPNQEPFGQIKLMPVLFGTEPY